MYSTFGIATVLFLITVSLPSSAGVPCTVPPESIGNGEYLKDVDSAVDDALAQHGSPASFQRSRRTTWEEGGTMMTFLVEDNGTEVLTIESWSVSEGEVSKFPNHWREYPLGVVQIGVTFERVQEAMQDNGFCYRSSEPTDSRFEECHVGDASYYLGVNGDGVISSVEVRRLKDDWEQAIARRHWLNVLGSPTSDKDITQWSFTTVENVLVRTGDYLAKTWTVRMKDR